MNDLEFIPRELRSRSWSGREIVLRYDDALRALDELHRNHIAVLGWEGWLIDRNGAASHASKFQGTAAIEREENETWPAYVARSVVFSRKTINSDWKRFRSSAAANSARLWFCLTAQSEPESEAVLRRQPYSRRELLATPSFPPQRGLPCAHCNHNIPQFAELAESARSRVLGLADEGKIINAIRELRSATDAPLTFAHLWVAHRGAPMPPEGPNPTPCPYCGRPLRTAQAKQCRYCKRDWHNPAALGYLDGTPQSQAD